MTIVSFLALFIILAGCGKQATEEECLEYLVSMDAEAFQKGKCEEYVEW